MLIPSIQDLNELRSQLYSVAEDFEWGRRQWCVQIKIDRLVVWRYNYPFLCFGSTPLVLPSSVPNSTPDSYLIFSTAASGGPRRFTALNLSTAAAVPNPRLIMTSQSPAVSGGKKRALEALERRFAAVKAAEVLQEQRHQSKRIKKASEETNKAAATNAVSASPVNPDLATISRKGNRLFSGFTPFREASGTKGVESQPAYFELSQMVHENLIPAGSKTSHNGVTVSKVVHNILQSGDKGHQYIRGSRSMKIDNWLLLDNFVPRDNAVLNARVKALQSHSKRSGRHMSMRQHRKCGSFDLPKNFHKFDLFKPMHDMWKEYINELLKQTEKKQLAQILLAADLHGAFLVVVECKTTTLTGATGIMIRETTETFGIITQGDVFRVVPKRGSVFIFQAGCWKITLHGDKLSSRNTVI